MPGRSEGNSMLLLWNVDRNKEERGTFINFLRKGMGATGLEPVTPAV
jgi:hypothetical protein